MRNVDPNVMRDAARMLGRASRMLMKLADAKEKTDNSYPLGLLKRDSMESDITANINAALARLEMK